MKNRKRKAGAASPAASPKSAGPVFKPDHSISRAFPKSQMRGWPIEARLLLAVLL